MAKEIHSLDDLFIHGLEDIYYTENQIIKSLPTMIKKAKDDNLKRDLMEHLDETKNQVRRLGEIFEMHGKAAHGTKCPAIDGILAEAKDVMGKVADADVRNSAMIAAAQAVEHYEIARYGTLVALANELGDSLAADLLKETLNEEKAIDQRLTDLAERDVNHRAHQSGEEAAARAQKSRRAGVVRSGGRATAARRKSGMKASARRGRPAGKGPSGGKSRASAKSGGRARKAIRRRRSA